MFKLITIIVIAYQMLAISNLQSQLDKHKELIEIEEQQIVVLSQAAGLVELQK